MNTTKSLDWSREAHLARRVQAISPDYLPAIIAKQAAPARPNARTNLPGLLARQLDRELAKEASANAALAPMAKLPAILALRVIRAAWEGLTR